MQKKASISVFLALICLCVISIIMISLESARTSGARWQAQFIASSSLDSLFSEYNIGLWKNYKVALLEYLDEDDLKDSLYIYANSNVENISNYRLDEVDFSINEKKMIVDEGGAYLEKEMIDFIKYAPIDIAAIFKEPQKLQEKTQSANSSADIADDFDEISKIGLDLEKQAKVVADILSEISNSYNMAKKDIENRDTSSFNTNSEKILNKIGSLNKAFEKYKSKAKKTREKIEKASRKNKEKLENLEEDSKNSMKDYANAYEIYNEEQSKRLEDLEQIVKSYTAKKSKIKEAQNIADNIEELEESEDAENDYSSEIDVLYEDLETLFYNLGIDASLSKSEVDEEKKNILLDLKDSIDKGVLALVLPKDREFSAILINKEYLASSTESENERTLKKLDLFSRVLCLEYIDRFFNDYTDENTRAVAYEKEYILIGEDSDEKNLAQTVERLLLLRTGLNYISIIKDQAKVSEVKALANLIMGACALPHLAFLMEFLILSLWALAESVADIKSLLMGGEVPLLKTEKDFKLSLNSLFDFSKSIENLETEKADEKSIFTYANYLKILLLMEKQEKINYRILDLMELNERKDGNNIRMKNMLYGIDVDMSIKSNRLFSNFVYEGKQAFENDFYIRTRLQKAY